MIEWGNSLLFGVIYGRKLRGMEEVLGRYQQEYAVEYLKEGDVAALVQFFQEQPEEAFTYFKPHGFDEKTIRKIQRSRSFLAFVVKEQGRIVGYFFMRCDFIEAMFSGAIVPYDGMPSIAAISVITLAVSFEIPLFRCR